MRIIRFVPGAVVSPAAITIPASAPDILAVVAAEITRTPLGLCNLADHAAADIIAALADHPQPDVVAAIADHPAHGHDMTCVVPAGGGGAVTAPAVAGPIEEAAGPVTHPGAVDNLAAAQAHTDGAMPAPHVAGAAPVAHAGGADPVVAATPTRLTTRTISLNVNTLLGDLLTLAYFEVGERVPVS